PGGQVVTITPAEPLVAGAEYNIHVQAIGLTGATYVKTGFFFGSVTGNPPDMGLAAVKYQETSAATPSRLTSGDKVYVYMNQGVSRLAADGLNVQVFFDADIDGDGKRESVGELGNHSGKGIDLLVDEPTQPLQTSTVVATPAVFPLVSSGFTSRFS